MDTSNIKKGIITENLAKATKFLPTLQYEAADQHIKIGLLIRASTYSTRKRPGKTECDTMVMRMRLQIVIEQEKKILH